MELVSMMHNTEQMKPDTDGNPVDVKKNVIPQTMYPLFQAFLFWITVFGCVALLIGFVTPGWLCAHVTMMTTVIDDQDFYSDATNVKHTLVYQNYGLWYVIQCELLEEGDECDTRSYSIITSMDHGINDNMKIPNIDNEPNLYFNGNGIVFSFSTLRGLEVMYTIAIVFSLYILYSLYYVRKQRQQNALSKLRWTFLSFLALVSGILVLVPVHVFSEKGLTLGKSDDKSYRSFYNRNDIKSGLGIYFGGIGAAVSLLSMVCMFVFLYNQGYCCRASNDTSTESGGRSG